MRGPHAHDDHPPSVIVDETAIADFAFADTVVAGDLDEAIPPSGMVIQNERGLARCLTVAPLVNHVLPGTYSVRGREDGLARRLRTAWARMRRGLQASSAEMKDLWSATASLEHAQGAQGAIVHDEDPLARAAIVGRRVRTFLSFFEWDRADLLRAAWIGLVVFVVVATVGAFALQRGPSPTTSVDVPASGHDVAR